MRESWKPSKEKLDLIRIELGEKAAYHFHTKYRISKERCCNPNNKDYDKYKGKFKFKNFVDFFNHCYEDFKKAYLKYGNTLSIDRINGDLGYEPGNVRFVPMVENLRNKKIVIPTKVIDVETGKEFHFVSLCDAKKYFNGSGAFYQAYIKHRIYRNKYLIMRDDKQSVSTREITHQEKDLNVEESIVPS